ncbi:MAG: response regulator [Candidatus Eisenbacteria bacterium]|nr:response regulator [Candidatus Eisenbacteria bacterium]
MREDSQADDSSSEQDPSRPSQPARRRILIIEDSLDTATSFAQVFEILGYEARIACDGHSGIERAREMLPDAILCDIGLPDIDGHEVARTLRSDPRLSHTLLIALTGYVQHRDREKALEAGFAYHVAKPVSIETLLRLLPRP